jgi:hypothetical protein
LAGGDASKISRGEDEEAFRQMSHDFEARIRDSFAKQV